MENTNLSEREIEIIRLVGQGKSNKEIAQILFISVNTVKVHLANIFKKIKVSSRTEATIYAIEHKLIDHPRTNGEEVNTPGEASVQNTTQLILGKFWWVLLIVVIGLFIGLSGLFANGSFFVGPTPTQNAIVDSLSRERWASSAALLQPRAGMAVTTVQNSIYVIGGITAEGVSGSVQRFDKTSNSWTNLSEKPTPVSGVNAAVVGGKIYVPGGVLADGDLTNVLEVYSPETDAWETYSSVPFPLSNFGISAFEGKIYLFGGWDNKNELNTVLKYDPSSDEWNEVTSLPTARTDPAVVSVGDDIFVIGGYADGRSVSVEEVYTPSKDAEGGKPWSSQIDLPENFILLGAQNVMGSLFIFGRNLDENYTLLNFSPQNNVWNEFDEISPIRVQQKPCLTVLGGEVYFIGGYEESGKLTDSMIRYQAVYTIVLPRITY